MKCPIKGFQTQKRGSARTSQWRRLALSGNSQGLYPAEKSSVHRSCSATSIPIFGVEVAQYNRFVFSATFCAFIFPVKENKSNNNNMNHLFLTELLLS